MRRQKTRHLTQLLAWLVAIVLLAGCGGGDDAPVGGDPVGGDPVGPTSTSASPTGAPDSPTSTPITSAGGESILDVLERIEGQRVERAETRPRTATTGDQLTVVAQYLDIVIKDADAMWAQLMAYLGLQEQAFAYKIIMPGQQYQSQCAGQPVYRSNYNNAIYCEADSEGQYTGTVYLPVETFLEMWSGDVFDSQSRTAGEFTAAVVAVHEVGHEAVAEIVAQTGGQGPVGKYNELVPDCFAGLWLARQYYQGLTSAQYEQALDALEVIGDYAVTDPQHHGTPAERRQAILDGYSGYPESCWKYWVTS